MKKTEYKGIVKVILVVLVIIIVFTFIDYLFHLISEEYSVPSYYYKNKVIYGTVIGLITYFFIRNKNLLKKALIFSGVVAVLLQIRYYLEGYALDFVVLFLFVHFAILLIISYFMFKVLDKTKIKIKK
jgi:hypothetical protein